MKKDVYADMYMYDQHMCVCVCVKRANQSTLQGNLYGTHVIPSLGCSRIAKISWL